MKMITYTTSTSIYLIIKLNLLSLINSMNDLASKVNTSSNSIACRDVKKNLYPRVSAD